MSDGDTNGINVKTNNLKKEVKTMEHRIYKLTEKAIAGEMTWETAIYNGEIETVKEFETLEESLEYFENELCGDTEMYGVE